ncbi:MAG: periplasmic heavy metal sensor [Nitrospirota bacterium]
MKMRKWLFIVVVVSAIFSFAGSVPADEGSEYDYDAETMGEEMVAPCMKMSGMTGKGMMAPGMKHPMMGQSKGMMGGMPPMMNMWEDLQAKLELTDEQAAKFRKIHSDYRKEVMRRRVEIEIAEMDLMEQLRSKDADDKAIEDIANKIQSSWSSLNAFRVKTLLKTKSFLSDKQYQELVHIIMDWRSPHMMGGWGNRWH